MAREQRTFDLGWENRACIVHELGALPSRQVARRLLNIVGKAMREGMAGGSLESSLEMVALMGVGAVLEQLDDATTTWLTNTFLEATVVEREAATEDYVSLKEVQELAFRGADGLARWLHWLTYCVETSCGDFFDAVLSEVERIRKARIKTATPNTAQATTTDTASGSPSTSRKHGSITA